MIWQCFTTIPKRTPIRPRGVLVKATTLPRLYRSPDEPFHWVVWMDDGWFRFAAKPNGWVERCAVTNVSRQKLQPVPLRMAFNTGLIESFELQVSNRAA